MNMKWWLSLIIYRYALNQGAAAVAVDIEEVKYLTGLSKSNISSVKVLQHPIQRRTQAMSPAEISDGNSFGLSSKY